MSLVGLRTPDSGFVNPMGYMVTEFVRLDAAGTMAVSS